MNECPVGICLMINNVPNLTLEEEQLVGLFSSLAFEVQVKRDLTMTEIYEVARQFAGKDHKRYNSFVFIVMSLCSQGHDITGVDRRKTSVEQVMSEFKASNCPSLQNKPKLFFVLRFTTSPVQLVESHDSSLLVHFCTDEAMPLFSSSATPGSVACPEETDFLLTCVTSPVVEAQQTPEYFFIQVRTTIVITFFIQ